MKRWLFALSLLAASAQADEGLIQAYVFSNAEHTLWHEAGHALISEFGLPVIGQEEDAVDAFATLMMLSDESEERLERLLDVAEVWMLSHERAEADGIAPDYFDEHDLDAQRGLRVICFLAGEGPGRAHELIENWGLPEDRAESCEEDYALAVDSWDVLLEPFYREQDARIVPVEVRYGPGRWREALVESELLELVAETLSYSYALEPGLMLEAASCGEPNAFWDPEARTMTLCYELLADYEDLAREAIGQ